MTNTVDSTTATKNSIKDPAKNPIEALANQETTLDDNTSKIKFADFALSPSLVSALDKLGFTNPTEVQEKTLSSALLGKDLMVSAQTGSGKTAAFLLPCLTKVISNLPPEHSRHKKARPEVLIICPTRELVQQVFQDAIKLVADSPGIRIASVMGGMSYPKQIAGLKGAQVVIATPGRLLDLADRQNIQLDNVSHLVLDEADRMLDLGFSEALADISKLCAKREQTLLFSATFATNIVGLATKMMDNPERIELANSQDKHNDITQSLYWANDEEHKQALILYWLKIEKIDQAVIFTPTQVMTEKLALLLRKAGHNAVDLHGGMQQHMRMKQIKKLRDGKAKILVATDVAARGLDVPTISHVFNFGIPTKNEDYVHRIGRTGRAGRQGTAITVAAHSERRNLLDLQHFLKQDIDVSEVPGMAAKPYEPRNRSHNPTTGGGRGRGRGGNASSGGRTGGNSRGKATGEGSRGKTSGKFGKPGSKAAGKTGGERTIGSEKSYKSKKKPSDGRGNPTKGAGFNTKKKVGSFKAKKPKMSR